MSRNGNEIGQWFITFPQSGTISKQNLADALPPLEYAKIVLEEHKDGSPHLHAWIKLKHKLTKPKFLRWFKVKFPNDYMRIHIGAIRSVGAADDYVGKEDPEPLVIGSATKTKKKTQEELEDYFLDREIWLAEETYHAKLAEYRFLVSKYETPDFTDRCEYLYDVAGPLARQLDEPTKQWVARLWADFRKEKAERSERRHREN